MSESRKNHFTVDGGQETEVADGASYKPIPESDTGVPLSAISKAKSKEKVVTDEAEEKLLSKEDEAKIATRVDMAEAKYVVGDHRNGDAKIELDANKRQFSGLTKEELLKFAEDPFWVRLRWFMFVLFWALWLCMLAGAIAIIIRAPKCYPPTPKTWFEIGPLADHYTEEPVDYSQLEAELPLLEQAKVQGVFINPCAETYEVLEKPSCLDQFKAFLEKAKAKGIKLIVDLTANYVPKTHEWFTRSENKTEGFEDFFVWDESTEYVPDGSRPDVPNTWRSRYNEPAWSWSDARKLYYLHQFRADQPDLNFHNERVVAKFVSVLKTWIDAGAAGVRLRKARQLLVNKTHPKEEPSTTAIGVTQDDYLFYKHTHTSDHPHLDILLASWAAIVTAGGNDNVFTLHEDGVLMPEWYVLRNASARLHPPSAAPRHLTAQTNLTVLAKDIDKLASNWTALQLSSEDPDAAAELAAFSLLLPLTPLLAPAQLPPHDNVSNSEEFSHVARVREDASIKFGERRVLALRAHDNVTDMLVCARWKAGHTGYVALFNPGGAARANLTALESVPDTLTVFHVSHPTHLQNNYTSNLAVAADNIFVPSASSVILSYVPKTAAEK